MEEKGSRKLLVSHKPALTRRELLIGAGMVAGGLALGPLIAACGSSPSTGGTSTTPKKGGNFRLGVTGGGAKDMIDGQNIVT
ncbi:MAG: hypothetical protein M3003_09245, partial [Candidatus Dormibacteraeota bacterium]|nr:hypothetical protein [Candidatus Dormibacteraeota bacterium]